jgi:hypothetical protein
MAAVPAPTTREDRIHQNQVTVNDESINEEKAPRHNAPTNNSSSLVERGWTQYQNETKKYKVPK